jgi:hypothetical protein
LGVIWRRGGIKSFPKFKTTKRKPDSCSLFGRPAFTGGGGQIGDSIDAVNINVFARSPLQKRNSSPAHWIPVCDAKNHLGVFFCDIKNIRIYQG